MIRPSLRFLRAALLASLAPLFPPALAAPAGKSYAGLYCLPAGENPTQQIDLAREPWPGAGLTGIALRSTWNAIEKKPGDYDWSFFDQALALAHQHNKKISLSVAAGAFVPDWVETEGATHLDLLRQTNFAAPREIQWVPPWDPVLQKEWGAFIRALAARYDNDPDVGYVYIGGPGIYIETYVVQTEPDYDKFVAAGGLPKWIEGTEALIDIYGAAFSHTPFFLAIANPVRVPAAHREGEAAVEEVVQYGLARYPGRFGLTSQGLNEKSATRGANFFVNRLIRDAAATSPTGYQMVGPVSGKFVFGHAGDLAGALDGGIRLGARFIEVYKADCENPAYSSLLARINRELVGTGP